MYKKIAFILFLFCPFLLIGQKNSYSTWIGVQYPVSISTKWQWHNDAGFRTISISGHPSQMLYRTGVRRLVNNHFSYALGGALFFTRTTNFKENDEFGTEQRIWEEALLQKKINNKLQWTNRFRLEQRWFMQTDDKNAFFASRFRIKTLLSKEITEKLSIQLADEYMAQYDLGKLKFNQNRVQLLTNISLNKKFSLQVGYMFMSLPSTNQHCGVLIFQKS